jgi:hypothetical protein
LLKERASAHERVRAIVVTGVTPEVGVTWRVARVYVLCWVESRVIPHCILGRESCMIPQTDVAPEGGMTCRLCCVLESRVIPCGTLGRVMTPRTGVTPEGGVTWRVALHMLLHSMHDA